MIDTMVERVARALHAVSAEPEHRDIWERLSEQWRENFRAHARAAIRAMREPTPEMIVATLPIYGKHNHGDEPYTGEIADYFRAMIDAAEGER